MMRSQFAPGTFVNFLFINYHRWSIMLRTAFVEQIVFFERFCLPLRVPY